MKGLKGKQGQFHIKGEDSSFRMLYVIGILFVVTSHASGGGIQLFNNIFQENAFHMPLFLFASGYFYKSNNESNVKAYIKKKIKHLIVPLICYNFAYGFFVSILHTIGFDIGANINLYSLFISPFVYGSDFVFNCPDWFVAQLFIVELINILSRKILCNRFHIEQTIVSIVQIVLGFIVVCISIDNLPVYGVIIFRTIFCLSWYGFGNVYRDIIEEKESKIKNGTVFIILIALQLVLLIINEGVTGMSVVRFGFNGNNFFEIYLNAICGIAFWLRICRIFSPIIMKNSLLTYISRHTFSILENHFLGFWIVNLLYFFFDNINQLTNYVEFNLYRWQTDYMYKIYLNNSEQSLLIYVVFGIGVPLIISRVGDYFKSLYLKRRKNG